MESGDERWRVFSGLDGDEEEEEELVEEVDDGVREEDETRPDASGTPMEESAAMVTWKRPAVKPPDGGGADGGGADWTLSGLSALFNWASRSSLDCCD